MTTEVRLPNAECQAACRHGASGLAHALGAGASSLVAGLLTVLIRAYQLTISPAQRFLFGATAGCRYTPTCSVYAVEALRAHGAVTGTALAARRICRCHPWGGCGPDPVPPAEPRTRRI
jgi:hypothetical protein